MYHASLVHKMRKLGIEMRRTCNRLACTEAQAPAIGDTEKDSFVREHGTSDGTCG